MRQLWSQIAIISTFIVLASCQDRVSLQHETADPDSVAADETSAPPTVKKKETDLPPNGPSGVQKIQIYTESAQVAERQGDWIAATAYYAAVADLDPTNRNAVLAYVRTAKKAGLRARTVQILSRYNVHDPNDLQITTELGAALISADKPQPAVDILAPACQRTDTSWRTCSTAAVAYDRLQQFDKARAFYDRALQISNNQPAVLHNYALSRAMANDMPAATRLAQQMLSIPNAPAPLVQNMRNLLSSGTQAADQQ